jgi:CubicO group peptidase (beta-lactamase class C family)
MYPLIDQNNPIIVSRSTAWRAAEIPSGNGYANAHALARIASVLAVDEIDGKLWFSPATIDTTFQEQCHGIDFVLGLPFRWALGFAMVSQGIPIETNPRTLFMGGGGGSAVVIDRDAQLSMAYVMNNCLGSALEGDDRALSLFRALYAVL